MKKTSFLLILTLSALVSFPLLGGFMGGCGDRAAADDLVQESEALRRAALDRFRRQTAAFDALIKRVEDGGSLAASEIEVAAGTASREYEAAIADLDKRSVRLGAAAALELDESYREYLRLTAASNDRLREALTAAAEIPALMLEKELVFSGWDEIGAAGVLEEIGAIRQRVEAAYGESESLRAQAEKIREDNPDDF